MAWAHSVKLNPSSGSHCQSLGATLQGENWASKLPAVIGIRLYETKLRTKKRYYQLQENVPCNGFQQMTPKEIRLSIKWHQDYKPKTSRAVRLVHPAITQNASRHFLDDHRESIRNGTQSLETFLL
ncbi:hypothetical protein TNCV_5017771 [Trichonephila clavipes]|nr:hypothetical protein TNCV_5017771 [Trichonephila clavipes]